MLIFENKSVSVLSRNIRNTIHEIIFSKSKDKSYYDYCHAPFFLSPPNSLAELFPLFPVVDHSWKAPSRILQWDENKYASAPRQYEYEFGDECNVIRGDNKHTELCEPRLYVAFYIMTIAKSANIITYVFIIN
jgi:hypothetical protein